MSTWSAGYVTEVEYTQGYYRELSPVLLRHLAVQRGVAVPAPRTMRYLELGFGQGLSFAIHAAACPGEFWGTDINPAHAAMARQLLDAAGVEAQVRDVPFAELAAEDLPLFDVITLHGIWSWVSEENRATIVDLIRRKLAFGGLVYISYNVLPGWGPIIPLRHLLKSHTELAGAGAAGIAVKINAALAFTQRLIDVDAAFFTDNPMLAKRIEGMRSQDRAYLAHEYFNRDWLPMSFSDAMERLDPAKLDFVSSAALLDHLDVAHLTPGMAAMLAEIGDPTFRETVRDYMINRQFRKDVLVKGKRLLTTGQLQEVLLAERIVLLAPVADVPRRLTVGRREVDLQEAVYTPLLQIFAEGGYRPVSLGGILAHPVWAAKPLATLLQAVAVLIGAGFASPAQAEATAALTRPRCVALNAHLMELARLTNGLTHLASPVIGGGVAVTRFQQMFLTSRASGELRPEGWAAAAYTVLSGQNQRVIKDGTVLETPEENLAELTRQAQAFAAGMLPVLVGLAVA